MKGSHDDYQGDLFDGAKNTDDESERLKGMHRVPDHLTSIQAAAMVENIRHELQLAVIEAFRELGPMTDQQLERLPQLCKPNGGRYAYSTVRKRRSELYFDGLVVIVGETINDNGANMYVWDLHEGLRRKP